MRTGRWLAAQRQAFGETEVEWIGADPSVAMLAEASAKGIRTLIRAQAEQLPLPAAVVDYVACSYAFHHFTDKERALDEVKRVLVGTGAFRINNIEPAAADGWWLYEFFPRAVVIDAARFWPVERVAAALHSRGFTVEAELEEGVKEIAAAEAVAEAERRVVSQLALLDDSDYERGLSRLRRAAAEPDAKVTTTRSRLCLTAWRVA